MLTHSCKSVATDGQGRERWCSSLLSVAVKKSSFHLTAYIMKECQGRDTRKELMAGTEVETMEELTTLLLIACSATSFIQPGPR